MASAEVEPGCLVIIDGGQYAGRIGWYQSPGRVSIIGDDGETEPSDIDGEVMKISLQELTPAQAVSYVRSQVADRSVSMALEAVVGAVDREHLVDFLSSVEGIRVALQGDAFSLGLVDEPEVRWHVMSVSSTASALLLIESSIRMIYDAVWPDCDIDEDLSEGGDVRG